MRRSSIEPVVLLLADISGYTRFMLDHAKAQEHGQMIVGTLLQTILAQATTPIEVSKLEGDAVFMFARKNGASPPAELSRELGERIGVFFGEFQAARDLMARTAICRCGACANVGELNIKLIVHSGQAVISDFAGLSELSGVDVILIHRLLKNSVPGSEYLLLTTPAREEIDLPPEKKLEPRTERYDDVGEVELWVLEGERVMRTCPTCVAGGASDLAFHVIRREVQGEYRDVALHPEKGFHFHTGRRLAEMLEYEQADIEAVPPTALESFAGTGNPFTLGEIPSGAHVVDIGCGAGLDTLIASRRVGTNGRVLGVDMTDEMVQKAHSAAGDSGTDNVTIAQAYAESLPVPDGWADIVISNGVLNLCPDKPAALGEWYRALKAGGHLRIADIVVEQPIPEAAKGNIDLWTG
ncbi:MAG TPA: DUF2652 domain-containing protein [Gemmatimonadota bacterium]|nr:DUF2652 domain-containing protein [Gemmatimonadota bacterium]